MSKYISKIILDETEYDRGYNDGRVDTVEEFRVFFKSLEPCNMPKSFWDKGVDNACDKALKGELKEVNNGQREK